MVAISLIIGIVLVAVVVLLLVKNRRRPRLRVNGVLLVQVDHGASLMTVLADHGVQLPGTCGGKGACAGCKCQIFSGGGAISPQEAPYFSKAAVRDHWRLACQVVVRGDMAIRIAEDLLPPGTAKVPKDRSLPRMLPDDRGRPADPAYVRQQQ